MGSRLVGFAPVYVAFIVLAVVGTYWPTVSHLIAAGDGLGHAGLVFCIFFAAIWSLRQQLGNLPIEPAPIGLLGLFAGGIVWLAAELVYVRFATELAVVSMIAFAVLTILGYRWLSTLSFPLFFLLFCVPIGGPIVPILVEWTATVAVWGLHASGLTIHRDGTHLQVSSGNWSIADTCSGISFLNTSLMLGTFFAWVVYRSTFKRICFVTGVLVIAIAGNWLRVYLTILVAHLSDNRFLRDSHGTHGWVLYAAILVCYGWLGIKFQDTNDRSENGARPQFDGKQQGYFVRGWSARQLKVPIAAMALGLLCAWPLLENTLAQNVSVQPVEILDITSVRGWKRVDNPFTGWTPILQNPSRERVQSFEKDGHVVSVYVGIFQNQSWYSKLVTSVNRLADTDDPTWKLISRNVVNAEFVGKQLAADSGVIVGKGKKILAWKWYWIDGIATSSDVVAKLRQLKLRLDGSNETSAWIAVYTGADDSEVAAAARLAKFMRDSGSPILESINEKAAY